MVLKVDLAKLLKALPVGVPYAGAVLGSYRSQLSTEEVRQLLVKAGLSREEMLALLGQQQATILDLAREIADESEQRSLQTFLEGKDAIEQILRRLDEFQPDPREAPGLSNLVAVIPVGGDGGGMQPLTSIMPKTLVPIHTKPLLIHILESLDPRYFKKAIVTADVWFPMIDSYVKAFCRDLKIDVDCQYLPMTPPQQLVKLRSQLTEPFLLHYGDVRTEGFDWKHALQLYQHHKGWSVDSWFMGMVLVSKTVKLRVGVVKPIEDSAYTVGEFLEKPLEIPSTALIAMGMGLFERALVDRIGPDDESVFGDVVPRALRDERGKMAFYQHGQWDHLQHMDELYECQARYYPHMGVRK